MAAEQSKSSKNKSMKQVKCMNHDPINSKWGQYAPDGGCQEKMWIDERSTNGLCASCVQRSVNNMRQDISSIMKHNYNKD
jgi:hypothetical protein